MKMDDKMKNILAGVVAVVILLAALTVTFTPDLSLGNMLHSMAQMPGKLFRFAWEAPEIVEEPEPLPTEKPKQAAQKTEMPLVFFDNQDLGEEVPVVINPVEGLNELPEVVFAESGNG